MRYELFSSIKNFFRWYYSIGGKFLKKSRLSTLSVVLCVVVSQVLAILAFLLPLKVVMLVSSQRVPRYFPSILSEFDYEFLVLLLGGMSVVFYISHLLLEKFIVSHSGATAAHLLAGSNKVVLFENQDDLATNGYLRYVRSVGGVLLVFLISVAIAAVYFEIFLVLLGYSVCTSILGCILYARNPQFASKDLTKYVKIAASVGFLFAFFFILLFYFLKNDVQPLVAILTIILARQLSGRVASTIADMRWLNAQKNHLNVLFFHGHVLLPKDTGVFGDFWGKIYQLDLQNIFSKFISEQLSISDFQLKFSYRQSGIVDVAAFDVVVASKAKKHLNKQYLVKIYNKNRVRPAIHESLLLFDMQQFPAPRLMATEMLDDLQFHLFDVDGYAALSRREARLLSWKIVANLMKTEPSASLKSSYTRSRQLTWHQINADLRRRLQVAIIGSEEKRIELLDFFFAQKDIVCQKLASLPLVVVNPDLNADSMFFAPDKTVVCCHWGRWSLEPLGAGWPLEDWAIENLPGALEEAKKVRFDIKNVEINDVKLSAYIYRFLSLCQKQSFTSAIDLLPEIIACFTEDVGQPESTV